MLQFRHRNCCSPKARQALANRERINASDGLALLGGLYVAFSKSFLINAHSYVGRRSSLGRLQPILYRPEIGSSGWKA
jgi:hypothetical protein